MWIWTVFARDLLEKVIITVAANPYSLPPDFRKLPQNFEWPAYTGNYNSNHGDRVLLKVMAYREKRELQIRRQIIELRINMSAVPDRTGSERRARTDTHIARKRGK